MLGEAPETFNLAIANSRFSAGRFDGLLLKENKPPVLHEIRRGNSIRKDEIVLQLKVQFW